MIQHANRKGGRLLRKCFHEIKISCLVLNYFPSVLLTRRFPPAHQAID